MKLIIDIPDKAYNRLLEEQHLPNRLDIEWVITHGTPIPDNATNGDMIKAMFPNIDTYFSNVIDMKLWWKAKYKGAGEIQCIPTDEEIAKSFIEDVEAVKDLLPRAERR